MAKKIKEPKVKVGDRFGKLIVVEQIDMPIMTEVKDKNGNTSWEDSGRTKIGWRCKCDCGEKIALPQTTLIKKTSALRSCGKCPPEKDVSYIPKTMTFEENQEWYELYEYVKKNILGYNEEQTLPEYVTTRLLGLSRGKFMANNKTVNNAKYSYKVILNTFKFCYLNIEKALRTNNFKDEKHKVMYIFKIVENNINDVYIRMKNVEKAKEEAKNTMIDMPIHTGAEYKPREKKKDRFADLW